MTAAKTTLAIALAGVAGLAQAQVLEEVVVTAQKRETSLQDTPIAITAFTADSLESIGAFNATDIGNYTPNVDISNTFGSAGNIRASIRGISTGEPSLAVDPKVGMYLDGAYLARNAGAVFDIVDIERIEILRGPQGTLWGKNTTGGAINIITRKPAGEFGFRQALTAGSFGDLRSTTTLDTPAAGGFSAKISYMYREYDGWADNHHPDGESDLGSLETDALRVALRWEPSDFFSADYSYDGTWTDAVPLPSQIVKVGPGGTDSSLQGTYDLATGAFLPGYNPLAGMLEVESPRKRREDFQLDGQSVEETEISGHNLTLVWDTDWAQIKSISAYREYESDFPGNDLDGGAWVTDAGEAVPMFHAENEKDQDQFSQELQVIGSALDDRLDYTLGLFYFEEEGREINPWDALFYLNDPTRPVLLRNLGAGAGSWYSIENKSQAAFGQVKYYFNESWDLTLGLRYTEDEKEITLLDEDPRLDGPHTADQDWDKFTTDVVVGYRVNDDLSFYFKRAEGYNAGVFSVGALNHLDYTDFEAFDTPADPEETTSWEIGMKSEWWDNRLRVNAAVFYNDNENLQITEFVNGVRTLRNSGENETEGLEIDFNALLTDTLSLTGAYGYRKTDLDDGTARSDGKHSGSLALVYARPLNWGYLDARLDTNYTDAQEFSGSPFGNARSRTLLNARLGVSEIQLGNAGSLRIAAWGRNLTDEEYVVYGADLGVNQGLGYAVSMFGTPRSYGLDLVYEY